MSNWNSHWKWYKNTITDKKPPFFEAKDVKPRIHSNICTLKQNICKWTDYCLSAYHRHDGKEKPYSAAIKLKTKLCGVIGASFLCRPQPDAFSLNWHRVMKTLRTPALTIWLEYYEASPCCPHRLLCPRLRAIPEAARHSRWSDCCACSGPPDCENHL